MRLARSFRLATLFCLCLVALAGCTRKPTSTADMPRLLSPAYSVSVLPFIQPRSNAELVMGQLPEPQGHIDGSHLAILDNRLQTALRERKNSRRYAFVASGALPKISSGYSANQPQALPILAAFAAKSGTFCSFLPVWVRSIRISPMVVRSIIFLAPSSRSVSGAYTSPSIVHTPSKAPSSTGLAP